MVCAQTSRFATSPCFQFISTLLIWVLLSLSRVGAQSRRDEVNILLTFRDLNLGQIGVVQPGSQEVYLSAGGYWSSWNKNDENPCSWVGVTCTSNFTVEQLDFSGWGLVLLNSTAVQGFSGLPDLRQLDLSSNNLKVWQDLTGKTFPGTIPEEIGLLTGLTKLDMSRSYLMGSIPVNISSCRNLQYLSLEQNQLTGEIPSLDSLTKLQILLLGNNNLAGRFPKLGELTSLVSVDLSGNMLNETIPSLSNLTVLIELKLDNNNFTGFEEHWFIGGQSLERLSVSSNQLQGVISPYLTNLPNLIVLNLSRNQLAGQIPSGFSQQADDDLSNLSVDFSQNQLTGMIPTNLLGAAYSVNLSHNLLSGNIPSKESYSMEFLDLSHNNLSGPLPFFCKNDSFVASQLWLQNNVLHGDIVDFLISTSTGEGSCNGADFRLNDNLFTGDLMRTLSFDFSSLFGALDLSNNNLLISNPKSSDDALMNVLEKFTGLGELRIGGNNFSGLTLPAYCPFSFRYVEVLDLSNNQLLGEISGRVFNSLCFPTLQALNLSKNSAVGPIPESIILLNLETLDVSDNNLSGQLPLILPGSSLFNPLIFTGNAGLCGSPLPTCPGTSLQAQRTGVQLEWWLLLIIIGGAITIAAGSCSVAVWRRRVYHKKHQQDADLIKTLLDREMTSLMPLRELKKATNNFDASAQIGEGGFGTVFVGTLNSGTTVAIKRAKREGSETYKNQFLNEVKILSQVNHRHLVKLLGCCMENKIALLVFEFVSNGTLQDYLQGKVGSEHLTWKQRLNIAVQTADALNYLHSATGSPIYHRDVKSANILLDDELDVKVADFGISKLAPTKATHVSTVAIQGTMGYIDPDYYTSFQLTEKSDVYSFGVVLLELISAKPPIDFSRDQEETSLVYFATPQIQRGDLQHLIDAALMGTYNDPTGHGRESILDVGRLALKCVNARSKVRPSMKYLWKELQNLLVDFTDTSMPIGEYIEDDSSNGPQSDDIILFSKSFSGDSASFKVENDFRGIELLQSSSSTSFRNRPVQYVVTENVV